MPNDLERLEAERTRLFAVLSQIGDLRRGSIAVNHRRCGKANCVCAQPDHPGHGPQYLLMTKHQGHSRAKNLRPGPELQKIEQEVVNHRRFRDVVRQLIEVNERICEARPVSEPEEHPITAARKKTAQGLQDDIAREIEQLVAHVMADGHRRGHVDLEATELAIRAAMHEIGGRLLETLLNADGGGARGARIDCGQGHEAAFVDYRRKQLVTVLSAVEVDRAYYHCPNCRAGVIPKDGDLDIVDTSFSPGVRRMIGRVGAKAPFDEGREDLEALAGMRVKTKAVERVAEALGAQIEIVGQQERAHAFSGTGVPLKSVLTLYIAMDGTGVPMVPQALEGRKGKGETGQAKTREAKLGCVFTQTRVDDRGRPVRDEASTTYVGAIEAAEPFGRRLYAEAVRRGLPRTKQVIVLGDGARWIWGLAEEHFHGAIQIVDLYHAREHLARLGKLVYGAGSSRAKAWAAAQCEHLDAGKVEAVVTAMRRLRPRDTTVVEETRKAIEYFQTHRERMRYGHFRNQGLFVGSGVIEAGCKTIVGHRLKQSGMRWTVKGANDIIALRCCQVSGRWEEFWEARAAS